MATAASLSRRDALPGAAGGGARRAAAAVVQEATTAGAGRGRGWAPSVATDGRAAAMLPRAPLMAAAGSVGANVSTLVMTGTGTRLLARVDAAGSTAAGNGAGTDRLLLSTPTVLFAVLCIRMEAVERPCMPRVSTPATPAGAGKPEGTAAPLLASCAAARLVNGAAWKGDRPVGRRASGLTVVRADRSEALPPLKKCPLPLPLPPALPPPLLLITPLSWRLHGLWTRSDSGRMQAASIAASVDVAA